MTFEEQELAQSTRLLIELNEPEALLLSLQRTCQRKADSGRTDPLRASIPPEEAQRWRVAASALTAALATIASSQFPQRASHEPSEPIRPGGDRSLPEPSPIPTPEAEASAPPTKTKRERLNSNFRARAHPLRPQPLALLMARPMGRQ